MINRLVITCIVLSFSSAAPAATSDWDAGSDAFAAGDYASALQFFESARNDGTEGPAVDYNVAVCLFKLERFGRAGGEFQSIAERYPRMRGLAEYNLGLIARRSGNTAAATGHFLNAYRLSPGNETLRILSSTRLRELEPERRSVSAWAGALAIRTGFDDNVALRDETGLANGQSTDSPLLDFFASVSGPYSGRNGVRVDAGLYAVQNIDADDFNQAGLFGGVSYDWQPGDWRLEAGARLSAGSLGGDAFDRKAGAILRAARSLGNDATLDLSYRYDDVQEADTAFAGIAGSRQVFQARYRRHMDDRRFNLRYRQEENDRLDAGVSPKRKSLAAQYRYQPHSGWGYEGGISYRTSRFSELVLPRDEDLTTISLGLTRTLSETWLVLIDYRYSNNDSSDPTFSYDRNLVTMGAMKIF